MSELEAQIRVVAVARQQMVVAKEAVNISYTNWQKVNEGFIEKATKSAEIVKAHEEILRELTLKAYAKTGDKHPAKGVGIREVTKLDYDDKVALAYAKEHLLFLQLNKTAFEKFAKDEKPDFVTIIPTPQATIATNLEVE